METGSKQQVVTSYTVDLVRIQELGRIAGDGQMDKFSNRTAEYAQSMIDLGYAIQADLKSMVPEPLFNLFIDVSEMVEYGRRALRRAKTETDKTSAAADRDKAK